MIYGLGTDIVEVEDFERRLERGRLERVFTEAERAYADERPKRRAQTLAARWAAKEAFAKALGLGLRLEWDLGDIEVVNDENGRPELRIGESVRAHLPTDARVHLSLSHTQAYAAAVVVIETP